MNRKNPQRLLPIFDAGAISRSGFLTASVLTLISVFALGALSVAAQSGRRSTQPPVTPTPTPTPEPAPAATTSTDKDKTAQTIIVGMELPDNAYIPRYLSDDVLQGCAQRLDQAHSVKVDVERNMSRGDAIKRAKAQEESPVVFLRLRADSIGGRTSSSDDLSQVFIEYVIFSPLTAKVVSTGNVYQGISKGVVSVPIGRGGTAATEYRLKQAARDTADRILNALHIGAPHTPLL
jgi:hypothetical protein